MFSEEMFSASKKSQKQSFKKDKVKSKKSGKFDEETESYQMFSSATLKEEDKQSSSPSKKTRPTAQIGIPNKLLSADNTPDVSPLFFKESQSQLNLD